MTPQQMASAASEVAERWPAATIRGFYGNAAVSLDVIVDEAIVAQIGCDDGAVHALGRPAPADRSIVRW
jgi:hypothetical protein